MPDMREAFIVAASKKPEVEVSAVIRRAVPRVIRAEREERAFESILREANMTGHMWFKLRVNPMVQFGEKVDWNILDIVKKWDRLAPRLLALDDERREAALAKMAEGMRLLRDKPHSYYEGIAEAVSFIRSGSFRRMDSEAFATQLYPRVFVRAIEELTSCDFSYEVFSVGDSKEKVDINLAVERVSGVMPILYKPKV